MCKTRPTTITIDGPAASGKTTVGYQLAEKLGYIFLDTGVMYRAVTLATLVQGVDPKSEENVVRVAQAMNFEIEPEKDHADGRHYTVIVDGIDATWEIRNPQVNQNVSAVSSYPEVREELVRMQRQFAEGHAVVMVGRDIGTVVLPDAPVKIYLDASAEIRARRRMGDHLTRNYNSVEFETILADIERRDEIDSSREHSPLRPAEDAIIIDTGLYTPEDVLAKILEAIEAKSS
ncbi:MAG: (d)CMP kinase [Anaerolineae bacterium]